VYDAKDTTKSQSGLSRVREARRTEIPSLVEAYRVPVQGGIKQNGYSPWVAGPVLRVQGQFAQRLAQLDRRSGSPATVSPFPDDRWGSAQKNRAAAGAALPVYP
jgi:hypothetical protein